MTKKDRIAIGISAVLFMAPLFILAVGHVDLFVMWSFPLVVYWVYRFIKGDISFLGKANETK